MSSLWGGEDLDTGTVDSLCLVVSMFVQLISRVGHRGPAGLLAHHPLGVLPLVSSVLPEQHTEPDSVLQTGPSRGSLDLSVLDALSVHPP